MTKSIKNKRDLKTKPKKSFKEKRNDKRNKKIDKTDLGT